MDNCTALAERLGKSLKARGWMLALAESCTGGLAAQSVTAIPGSSAWFDRGFVTYSNQAKIDLLKVLSHTLQSYGAVSEQTAIEMTLGALANSQANIAASITGIAGPDGGTPEKPVGTVCFAWATNADTVQSSTRHFTGNRDDIRRQSVVFILTKLIERASR